MRRQDTINLVLSDDIFPWDSDRFECFLPTCTVAGAPQGCIIRAAHGVYELCHYLALRTNVVCPKTAWNVHLRVRLCGSAVTLAATRIDKQKQTCDAHTRALRRSSAPARGDDLSSLARNSCDARGDVT